MGIYYHWWVPLNPQQTSYCSVRELFDESDFPEQSGNGTMVLNVPHESVYENCTSYVSKHYRAVHHKKLSGRSMIKSCGDVSAVKFTHTEVITWCKECTLSLSAVLPPIQNKPTCWSTHLVTQHTDVRLAGSTTFNASFQPTQVSVLDCPCFTAIPKSHISRSDAIWSKFVEL